ncbi:MAG: M48 family metallopeptidase [Nitrospinales bacterium]
MEFSNKLPDGNVNISKESPLKEFAILLAGLAGIAVAVYFVLGLLIDYSVKHLSIEQEQALSFSIVENLVDGDYPKIAKPIQEIVDKLQNKCAHLPYDIRVAVIDDKMINAAALPGGTILVFTGLLDSMKSENELAFVLAHELGHFKNRDHLKGMGRLLVLVVGSVFLLGPNNPIAELAMSSINLAESSFSRGQESQADEFALKTLQCGYGHVGGATDFFSTMMEKESGSKIFGHYLSSHPDSQKRIDEINNQANQAGYPRNATIPLAINNKAFSDTEKS